MTKYLDEILEERYGKDKQYNNQSKSERGFQRIL